MSALNRVTLANVAARDAAPVVGTYICNDPTQPCSPVGLGGSNAADHHCWHESTRRRLEWQGGPSKGAAADLSAWKQMGAR